jgi:prepilin-type processing-associated H-X9-DG protein
MVQRAIACLVAIVGLTVSAQAACDLVRTDTADFTVCRYPPGEGAIETFSLAPDGSPLGSFGALETMLTAEGRKLAFAMNGGMFGTDLKPIGLYVEDGKLAKKLNRRSGYGNFHLKPNGVFYVKDGKAFVLETEAFAKAKPKPDFATQSGPMLVINGKIHPKISAKGTSRKIRNGVAVTEDGAVIFAISESYVTFFQFASLFRDTLGARNALFLDGSVSSLYAPELNRSDGLVPIGPILGVVAGDMQKAGTLD